MKKTTNDLIIEAIDTLIYCATGEQQGICEDWYNSNKDTVIVEDSIKDIEEREPPMTPKKAELFRAAYIAIRAIDKG